MLQNPDASPIELTRLLNAAGINRNKNAVKNKLRSWRLAAQGKPARACRPTPIKASEPSKQAVASKITVIPPIVEIPSIIGTKPDNERKHTVLISGDSHDPFKHPHYMDFLWQQWHRWKCDTFVHIGDEADMHTISKWPSEHDAEGGKTEYGRMIEGMGQFYRLFPKAKVCISNHTSRPYRIAHSVGIQDAMMKDYKDFMQVPHHCDWQWSDEWRIDGVKYFHGEGYGGQHAHVNAAKEHNCSIVMGHLHSNAGARYLRTFDRETFGLAVGCGIDEKAYAFRYGKYHRQRPVLGCGIVIEGKEAHFVPMGA